MTRTSKPFQKRTGKTVWTFTPISDSATSATPALPSAYSPQSPPSFPNAYSGFHPPSSSWAPPRIPAASLTPSQFFSQFIATRTPCVLTTRDGPAPEWTRALQTQWSSLSYLRARAGSQRVMVEEAGAPGVFGTAKPRVPSTFADFLTRVEAGDAGVYLTTQYAKADGEGDGDPEDDAISSIFPAPLPGLLGDFPPVPPPFATLVPQQLNLWIGHAPNAASSGLHHDYADNLYVLIRGRKRFTLFSPKDAHLMDLHGQVRRVHANGLIAYEEGIRADGAYVRDVARWKVEGLQREVERAGKSAESQEDWDRLEELEAQLDAALVEAGEAGVDVGGMGSDEVGDGEVDDFDALFADDPELASGGSDVDLDVELIEEEEGTSLFPPVDAPSEDDDDEDHDEPKSREPPSFSRIPTSALRAPSTRTPMHTSLLEQATQVQVTLEPGDMLYLPASWFHEVTSWSEPGDVHMALNYWMHPPTVGEFDAPYEDGFWGQVWEPVKRKAEKRTAGKKGMQSGKQSGGKKRGRLEGQEETNGVYGQGAGKKQKKRVKKMF